MARCRSAMTRRKEGGAMPTLVAETAGGTVPLDPVLSIFDPVHVGIDMFGDPVRVPMIERTLLVAGEPGAGKSALLNVVVAHAALSLDCRLCLIDAKQVELGQWRGVADAFVGPDLEQATKLLLRLQIMMDRRYSYLLDCERRKVVPGDVFLPYVVAIDEFAYYTATVGKADRDKLAELLRDLVAWGRAVGIIVVAATQRPSSDIIPTSLRDLFAWRFAGR